MDRRTLHSVIVEMVLEAVSRSGPRREEAIREFLGVSRPDVPAEEAKRFAELIPPLMPELYAGWAGQFADRLLETATQEQLEDMTRGDEQGRAILLLVYLMFMESERMQAKVSEDLCAYAREQSLSDELGNAAANFIRAGLSAMHSQKKDEKKGRK